MMMLHDLILSIYPSYMHLRVFVVNGDDDLKLKYINAANQQVSKMMDDPAHIDAGFDLFVPQQQICMMANCNKVDHKIKCSASVVTRDGTYNTGYYMHPRSSIYKTPLRLANSTGIIDAGYRGNIMGMFDSLAPQCVLEQHDRVLQICAPSLMPILVEIVDSVEELGEETARGGGGFGSTGR